MNIEALAADEDVRRAVREVITRFLDQEQPTPRPLVRKYLAGKGTFVDALLRYQFLRQPVNDDMMPGILAFEKIADPAVLALAKAGTNMVLITLKKLFANDLTKRRFDYGEVCHQTEQLFPEVLPQEIRAGLLLFPDIGTFASGAEWNDERSALKSLAVSDDILDYSSIDDAWQEKLARIAADDQAPPLIKTSATSRVTPVNKKRIFVIHGRNARLRRALYDFLRSLGLEPLEWSQLITGTGKGSPYNGDVVERGFQEVAAVVALLTPDDYAYLNPALLEAERGPKGRRRHPTTSDAALVLSTL